jgi:HEPN domain-containing protein
MKTFKKIADEDFEGAKALVEFEMWNLAGQHLQQACEKQLKGWLEENNKLNSTLAKTHNLRKLLREIGEYEDDFYKTSALVENYYFDTKYPGEDYIELNQQDIDEAIEFYDDLINFLADKSKDKKI